MKNMTAISLHFSSDDVDTSDGTGFMAGYATYVEGTISSDYQYNSCHKVTYTYRQAGFGCVLHSLFTFNDLKTHLIKQFRKITYKCNLFKKTIRLLVNIWILA